MDREVSQLRLPDSIFNRGVCNVFEKKSFVYDCFGIADICRAGFFTECVALSMLLAKVALKSMVAGSGTAIVVKISQTGVNDIPGISAAAALDIALAFDTSVVSLSGAPFGLGSDN